MVTADPGGWIYVIQMNPSLKRLLKNNYNFPHKKPKQKEMVHVYQISNILQATHDYVRKSNEEWVNFTRVSQYLRDTFPNLDLKAMGQANKNYKNLRNLIADYPSDFELRQDAEKQGLYWIRMKPKQSIDKQHKRKGEMNVSRDYNIDAVLQTARDFIRKRKEQWVNFTRVSQHLYETFPNLNMKDLGNYKNLRNLIADYPSDFELRQDSEKQGLYWICMKSKN